MRECRAELKKEKTRFKAREKELKEVIESQKVRIEELNRKGDDMRREMDRTVR